MQIVIVFYTSMYALLYLFWLLPLLFTLLESVWSFDEAGSGSFGSRTQEQKDTLHDFLTISL